VTCTWEVSGSILGLEKVKEKLTFARHDGIWGTGGLVLRSGRITPSGKISWHLLNKTVFLNRPDRRPVGAPGINYTRPREVFLEVVILVF